MLLNLTATGIYEFENSYLHLLLDEPARLMYSTWLRNPSSAEYREATMRFIDYFQEKDIAYWISDTTNLTEITKEDLGWVVEVLIPAANASGLQKIARVSVVDTNIKALRELVNVNSTKLVTTIEVEQFSTYREAVSWIVGEPC
ncbi:MAG: hypothetical protein ACO1OF_10845 [Adhaeribacter sp.]